MPEPGPKTVLDMLLAPSACGAGAPEHDSPESRGSGGGQNGQRPEAHFMGQPIASQPRAKLDGRDHGSTRQATVEGETELGITDQDGAGSGPKAENSRTDENTDQAAAPENKIEGDQPPGPMIGTHSASQVDVGPHVASRVAATVKEFGFDSDPFGLDSLLSDGKERAAARAWGLSSDSEEEAAAEPKQAVPPTPIAAALPAQTQEAAAQSKGEAAAALVAEQPKMSRLQRLLGKAATTSGPPLPARACPHPDATALKRPASQIACGSHEPAMAIPVPKQPKQPKQGIRIGRSLSCIQHWVAPMRAALEKAGVDLSKVPARDVGYYCACAGTAGELVGVEAFSLRMHCAGAADCSRVSRRWLQTVWPDLVEHVYEKNADFHQIPTRGAAPDATPQPLPYCAKCSGPCQADRGQNIDVLGGGYPCKPFTNYRPRKGGTAAQGEPDDHPDFHTLMTEFPQTLEVLAPWCFFLEEVMDVLRISPKTGEPYLETLMTRCAEMGYAVRAMKVDHAIWVELPRQRLFLVGVKEEAGGASAADWVVQVVQTAISHRCSSPPTPLEDIVPLGDHDEADFVATQQVAKSK